MLRTMVGMTKQERLILTSHGASAMLPLNHPEQNRAAEWVDSVIFT